MKYEDVVTWDDFVEYAKASNRQIKADMERIDKVVEAVGFVHEGLKECGMGIYLYNLDEPPIELENDIKDNKEKILVTA